MRRGGERREGVKERGGREGGQEEGKMDGWFCSAVAAAALDKSPTAEDFADIAELAEEGEGERKEPPEVAGEVGGEEVTGMMGVHECREEEELFQKGVAFAQTQLSGRLPSPLPSDVSSLLEHLGTQYRLPTGVPPSCSPLPLQRLLWVPKRVGWAWLCREGRLMTMTWRQRRSAGHLWMLLTRRGNPSPARLTRATTHTLPPRQSPRTWRHRPHSLPPPHSDRKSVG